jgi:hypothetical protein
MYEITLHGAVVKLLSTDINIADYLAVSYRSESDIPKNDSDYVDKFDSYLIGRSYYVPKYISEGLYATALACPIKPVPPIPDNPIAYATVRWNGDVAFDINHVSTVLPFDPGWAWYVDTRFLPGRGFSLETKPGYAIYFWENQTMPSGVGDVGGRHGPYGSLGFRNQNGPIFYYCAAVKFSPKPDTVAILMGPLGTDFLQEVTMSTVEEHTANPAAVSKLNVQSAHMKIYLRDGYLVEMFWDSIENGKNYGLDDPRRHYFAESLELSRVYTRYLGNGRDETVFTRDDGSKAVYRLYVGSRSDFSMFRIYSERLYKTFRTLSEYNIERKQDPLRGAFGTDSYVWPVERK